MPFVHQIIQTLYSVQLDKRNLGTGTSSPSPTAVLQTTSPSPTQTMAQQNNGGGTSSPLLFFVALGFGVVFTNLWIIVGVKYCFRYNARNRAIRNGEDPDPIGLENMPARPHRRRREKKLMTMDEVNERFPLIKYKNWVMSRASEGLPTAGGVTAPPSRTPSVRNAEGTTPSQQATRTSVDTRPETGMSKEATSAHPVGDSKGPAETPVEKGAPEESNHLQQVQTTASTVDKHGTRTSEDDEDEDDDHIHTAVPPELLTNPGDACAICIDTLEDDDEIRGLTCGHAFHAGCLDPWLTSRRACCPLCKADYYVPKPRPEGEAAEADRTGRRGNRTPQAPPAAWTGGIRSGRGFIIPGRFAYPADYDSSRAARRARRHQARANGASVPPPAEADPAVEPVRTESAVNTSRWRPRIANPFSNLHMPSLPGRRRQQDPEQSNADPTPAQLEAGRAPASS
ncbi:hypothetical protein B0O99DRAFT_651457 [Bisporella sp. PMI_857]|nr:hypothetical protein B0O99DRAFT_651457 [Bisporella sp. PMI_857]